jgi:threonine dehydrogenase-like Zn-dependent dehydrogenase
MRATVMYKAGDVQIERVADPSIQNPTDAIIRVTRACICGSDLWPYNGGPNVAGQQMGHEAIGVVEEVGSDVKRLRRGQIVVMPFAYSDGRCMFCDDGLQTACVHGGYVVGDGAVGLCGVLAAKRLGAEQIIIMGRHQQRIELARQFGATEVVSERGDAAIERVRELTGGFGVQSVLECVGTEQAIDTSMSIVRAGGAVGRVGVPHYTTLPGAQPMFFRNVIVAGGPAPVRAYIDELLPDVMEGHIEPGRVFDRTVTLDGVPDGYRAMNEREALKVMVQP